ncbi:uncharacterized protein BP5553_01139 [Venustampulla echinocandica]|uniref:Uncharacterized protein n=1 Tax=Venustampulla echinocandica TaxID=2656787 RepID=A0A370U050_9HELO|nr:uncharacterized protein BP5553_01139 [Venustampulla echinocandica]RDL41160.1 hypothetical protein BP5553_01139 [Venustampulla echinocandica]
MSSNNNIAANDLSGMDAGHGFDYGMANLDTYASSVDAAIDWDPAIISRIDKNVKELAEALKLSDGGRLVELEKAVSEMKSELDKLYAWADSVRPTMEQTYRKVEHLIAKDVANGGFVSASETQVNFSSVAQ